MKWKILVSMFAIGISSIAVSCAHNHVVQRDKLDEEGAYQATIGSKEVNVGDRVDVIKKVCAPNPMRYTGSPKNKCERRKIGEATVIKLLDESSSVVRFDPGVVYSSDLMTEKTQSN